MGREPVVRSGTPVPIPPRCQPRLLDAQTECPPSSSKSACESTRCRLPAFQPLSSLTKTESLLPFFLRLFSPASTETETSVSSVSVPLTVLTKSDSSRRMAWMPPNHDELVERNEAVVSVRLRSAIALGRTDGQSEHHD